VDLCGIVTPLTQVNVMRAGRPTLKPSCMTDHSFKTFFQKFVSPVRFNPQKTFTNAFRTCKSMLLYLSWMFEKLLVRLFMGLFWFEAAFFKEWWWSISKLIFIDTALRPWPKPCMGLKIRVDFSDPTKRLQKMAT
jgi:hypothetical protein